MNQADVLEMFCFVPVISPFLIPLHPARFVLLLFPSVERLLLIPLRSNCCVHPIPPPVDR